MALVSHTSNIPQHAVGMYSCMYVNVYIYINIHRQYPSWRTAGESEGNLPKVPDDCYQELQELPQLFRHQLLPKPLIILQDAL